MTGVVSAWADSISGIVICGNENSRHTRPDNPLRMWGVQGFDSVQMMAGVTKYGKRVMDPNQVGYEIEKAFYISQAGRPGPCWLEIPMDVQSKKIDPEQFAMFDASVDYEARSPERALSLLQDDIDTLLDLLSAAKRPLIWLGHGVRLANAAHLAEPLLDRLGIPALISWAGIDLVDSDHPLVVGRAGVYGQRAANFALQNCDFLLTIGTRLAVPQIGYAIDELARAAQIVVVDIDETEVNKLGDRIVLPICTDAKVFIETLLEVVRNKSLVVSQDWIGYCKNIQIKYPLIGPENDDQPPFINSAKFMDRLVNHLKADQVIVTDMGTALLSGHQILRLKSGQRLMTSTGLGEMGYGLPAAIGASFARNRGEVLCLHCDGGMMMNLQELQTIFQYRLPIKIIIFNNDGYLMIKHTQNNLFKGRYAGVNQETGVSCPNFSMLAKVFQFPAYQIRTWEDFDAVIPQVQAERGPVICEVFMHPEQLFVPKLSLASKPDGTIVSPPLEDLSPLLPRSEMRENMIIDLHWKSEAVSS